MMQLVVREEGAQLQKVPTRVARFNVKPDVQDKPKRILTVGKINLIRPQVKAAVQWGPAIFFRKGI